MKWICFHPPVTDMTGLGPARAYECGCPTSAKATGWAVLLLVLLALMAGLGCGVLEGHTALLR